MNRVLLFIFLLGTTIGYTQKNIKSPYSYYGLGERHIIKNTESILMGGVANPSDSTRIDMSNPASLGRLKLTAFSFAVASDFIQITDGKNTGNNTSSRPEYISLSFPIYKNTGISLGITPYSSIGYKLISVEKNEKILYEGNGGISQFYIAAGYSPIKGLDVGASVFFNFGKSIAENFRAKTETIYTLQDFNSSDYKGTSIILGIQYQKLIYKQLNLSTSLSYMPSSIITSKNRRSLNSIQETSQGAILKNTIDFNLNQLSENHLTMPSELNMSVGIGSDKKWFVAVSYLFTNMNEFKNDFITSNFVHYKQAYRIGFGGYYIPHHNSFTQYWKRITYRAGIYFQDKGIMLHQHNINEIGLTLGATLPIYGISNISVGGVYASRGTTKSNLVRENYFGIRVGFTLNDKWFQKSKYN